MIKYISIALLLLFNFDLSAQKKKSEDAGLLADRLEWSEGSIMLTDGKELKGLVKYNTRNGILSYQDGTEARVFTPLRVSAFEFFDESLQKQRLFYTLKYEDSETNVERPLFFEVLKEYKTFAVLSKSDRIDIEQKRDPSLLNLSPNPNQQGTRTVLDVSQTETIYLMNSAGEIKPYIKVIVSEDGVKDVFTNKDTRTKSKMIDRDLLEDFITPDEYQQLKKFGKDNDLSFRIKADFLKILNHYDGIISK